MSYYKREKDSRGNVINVPSIPDNNTEGVSKEYIDQQNTILQTKIDKKAEQTELTQLSTYQGDLTNLVTPTKTDLVSAVNEAYNHGGGSSIDTVEVSVDDNTGTPSATASVSGSTLTMEFKNLKGEKGDTGAQGNSGIASSDGVGSINDLDGTIPDDTETTVYVAGAKAVVQKFIDTGIEEVTTDDCTEDVVEGKFISNSGAVGSNSSFGYKEFEVKAGAVVTFAASSYHDAVAPIVQKTTSGYTVLKTASDWSNNTVTYTATEDMTIVLSFFISTTKSVTIKINNITKFVKSDELETLFVSKDVNEVTTDDCTEDIVEGKFISNRGAVDSNSYFGYKEFEVNAGAVVTLESKAWHSNVVPIAEKTLSGYTVLKTSSDVVDNAVTYTATEDMTIVVSFYLSTTKSVTIDTNNIVSNRKNIEILRSELSERDIINLNLGYMFDNIAGIGDSMLCGTLTDSERHDNFGASWLSVLAKKWGCTSRYHYSQGGTSAYQWLNDSTYGLGKMLADENVYNAYFIAYGHNDTADVGTAEDDAATVTIEGTTPTCASGSTFCAYYKAIIDQIRTKAPHAMIFCMSEYDDVMTGSHVAYGQAVKDIADLYYANGDTLVHHIDTDGVSYSDMGLGTHYSTVGYAYIAKRVDEEVNKVIYDNMSDDAIKYFGGYNGNNER